MLTKEQISGYVEDCDKLLTTATSIVPCIDIFKYNLNVPENSEDYPLYTQDMAALFEHLYNNCIDFIRAYEYYNGKRQPLEKVAELPEVDLEG